MGKSDGDRSGVLLVHPGTQHSLKLAQQLAARGLLCEYWTGLAIRRDGFLDRALGPMFGRTWRDAIANRVIDGVPAAAIHTMPWTELSALAQIRRGRDPEMVMHERNRRFQEAVPEAAFRRSRALVGFDTASWLLARRAKEAAVPFILDRSAPPPEAALGSFDRLAHAYPDWKEDLRPKDQRIVDAEHREHQSADWIVVASSFAKRCLVDAGLSADRIVVIPYGVDSESFAPAETSPKRHGVRFLFAGGINARKGVPLLLDAWQALHRVDVELTLVGALPKNRERFFSGIVGIELRGRVPRVDMPATYAAHDVFVFPSYHDGFGLVILEAMASGLPVIATTSTAGPDLISDGEDGFVIAAGDAGALAARMSHFARNPDLARSMGRAAQEKARRYSWASYGNAWGRLLIEQGIA